MKRAVQLFLGGPANARQIERLMAEARKEEGQEFDDQHQDALRSLLVDASAGRAYLACRNSDPIGYLTVFFAHCTRFGGRIAVIDEIYLDVSERESNVERRLIRGCIADLDAFGVQTVFAFCGNGDAALRACAEEAEGAEDGVEITLVRLASP